ncbi:MAG: spermidine synthase [Candidatus Sedimenticola sp. 20ELBAFRAG]
MPGLPVKRPPWLAIALLSSCALAYEVLLTRLFSLVHWHSLVGLIISLALLGYGASGTFLSLLQERLLPRFETAFTLNALLFGITSTGAFHLAQQLPLNPVELAWDHQQALYLAAAYLLLAIPFFAVANCIGLTLGRFRESINRIYAADLVGAGAGALSIVLLLFLVPADKALQFISVTGALAGGLGVLESRSGNRLGYSTLAVALCLALIPAQYRHATPAPYKDLSQALAASGSEVLQVSSNPLGVTTVMDNSIAPLRYAPGLSLASPHTPPSQPGIYSDGDFSGTLYQPTAASSHLDFLSSALPYHLLHAPRVLVIGAHDGTAAAQAVTLGAVRVDLVESNPFLVRLMEKRVAQIPPGEPQIALQQGAYRHYILASSVRYDLIQLSVADGLGESSGLQAQQENYLYTVESFTNSLDRLSPQGILAITRGLRMPPRDSLKLTAIALEALARHQVTAPSLHLAMIRSWNTVTLLVSRSPLSEQSIEKIRQFSRSRMFDLAYVPGMEPGELNRFHRLDSPYFNQGIKALLGEERERFMDNYRFRIEPATDNSPFFNRFTRLSGLRDLYTQPGRTGLAHIDWGVGLLLAALLLAMISSLALILLPLVIRREKHRPGANRNRWRILVYFGAIGLAFLFIEIAFIQQLHLFLGNPLYATATVLGGFLGFAGLGSYLSRRFALSVNMGRILMIILISILLMCGVNLWLLPQLLPLLADLTTPWRVITCLALLSPVATAMGMPFPLGLRSLAEESPGQIPWAWGINGCASVISALLAVLLAMEIGFSGLMMIAALLYGVAFANFPSVSR